MNRADIISMARESVIQAGFAFDPELDAPDWLGNFAALVATAEREACAKLCEHHEASGYSNLPAELAAAIRAREST